MKPKRLTLGIATPDFQFLAKNLFFPEQETLITARPQNPFVWATLFCPLPDGFIANASCQIDVRERHERR